MRIDFRLMALGIIKLACLACITIVCAFILYLFIDLATVQEDRVALARLVGLRDFANYINMPEQSSFSAADYIDGKVIPDHESVVARVEDCMGVKDEQSLPSSTRAFFSLIRFVSFGREDNTYPPEVRAPFREERAVIQLSKSLARQRSELQKRVDSSYWLWQITSITGVALGMLTTILVSMSSTDFGRGDGRRQQFVRFLAIVFPALSTAAAAIFAFYGPQASWTQASRTLAGLTQLHGQMALEIWNHECMKNETDASRVKMTDSLNGWSKRYLDIQTISSATGQGSSSGSTTSPTQTDQNRTPQASAPPPAQSR